MRACENKSPTGSGSFRVSFLPPLTGSVSILLIVTNYFLHQLDALMRGIPSILTLQRGVGRGGINKGRKEQIKQGKEADELLKEENVDKGGVRKKGRPETKGGANIVYSRFVWGGFCPAAAPRHNGCSDTLEDPAFLRRDPREAPSASIRPLSQPLLCFATLQ